MINLSFKNPFLIIVVALIVIVLSYVSIDKLAVDILPKFKTSAVQVLTLYPGMPAEVMEKDITSRIERWTGQSEGIAWQESKSIVGASIVRDHFREDIDPNTAMSHVTSYAMSDQYYLPPGTLPPMVMPYDPTASIPLCLLAVSSDEKSGKELYDIAYFHLRNMLGGIQGIVAPAVYGGKLRRIYIYVEPDKLEARGLSATDVMEAVQKNNTMIPTGLAAIGDINYNVNAGGMIRTVEEFNDIVIKYEDGAPVFVKDVGYAKDAGAIQTNIVRINGKRQVYLPVYKRPGANTIASVNGIKDALGGLRERLPPDVNLDVIFDQSTYVRSSINGLVNAGISGLILVVLVLFLFLGNFKSALIVSLSLPMSVLFGFIGLYVMGESINSMTLGGMALALGLLVDNSIVVLENTDRHLKMGKKAAVAALDAAQEVAMPVLVSTLVIITVFFPVAFLSGIAKYLFTPLAVSVACAMVGSYIFSLTLIPVAAAYFFRNHLPSSEGKPKKKSAFERGFDSLRKGYENVVDGAINMRWLTIVLVLLLLAVSLFTGQFLGYELFPKMDVGQIEVYARLEPGTRLEKTEEEIAKIEQSIREEAGAELNMLVSNIGVFYDWPAAYTPNSGTQDAFIKVQLKEDHNTSTADMATRLRNRLVQKFPGVEFSFNTGGIITAALNYGLPSPIDVQIVGNKLDVANGIARMIRDSIRQVNGAFDTRVIQRLNQPQLDIEVDRVKAAELGVASVDAVKNIVAGLNSTTTFLKSFWIDERNGNHYFIGVTYPEHLIDSEDAIGNVTVTSTKHNAPIPVKNFATIKHSSAPAEVNHISLARVTNVQTNVENRDIGSTAADIAAMIDRMEKRGSFPAGYKVNVRGEKELIDKSFTTLGTGLILAFILVYLIIVPLFRSFTQPLIIITAVPLGLIGVIAMLYLTHTNINIQSIMGVIMMVGISVSYGNILIDRINRLVAEGTDIREAIRVGAGDRLRPILMTTLTTIFGLLPMAIGLQVGGEANVPLARAIIGGVLAATLLTLVFIPVLYSFRKQPQLMKAEI